jgi:hypothetical protein
MWFGIKSVQRAFINSPRLKLILVVLTLVLLLASGYGVWTAYSMPLDWEERVTLVNYQQQGEFDYQVYIEPGQLFSPPPAEVSEDINGEEEEHQYFNTLIDNMEVSFNYVFTPDYPTTLNSVDVYIVAVIHGPSGWQKEVPLKSTSAQDNHITVSFPLELEDFDEVIDDVEEELEIRRYTEENIYDLVIEARVDISAYTGEDWLDDTFVQEMKIGVGRDVLTLDDELNLDQRRYYWGRFGGFSYKHSGSFSYTIWLDEDKTALYGPGVTELKPESYLPPLIIQRPSGAVYFLRLIDVVKSSFSYSFSCDQPVTNLVEEVEVTAVLEYPDMWQKVFTLVPETEKSGNFTLEFPLDVIYFGRLTEVIREELGIGAPTHDLIINAEVHTRAETPFGPIDEVFTQTLKGALGTATITWDEETGKSEPGAIESIVTVADPDVPKYRLWSRVLLGVLLFVFLFVAWHAIWAKPVMSKIEEEALKAKKRHKNVIVDIAKLPPARHDQIVIPVGSLEELIKIADSLLKPALHQASADKHTYCVIDGLTRYEYVSELWQLAKEELTEGESSQK